MINERTVFKFLEKIDHRIYSFLNHTNKKIFFEYKICNTSVICKLFHFFFFLSFITANFFRQNNLHFFSYKFNFNKNFYRLKCII